MSLLGLALGLVIGLSLGLLGGGGSVLTVPIFHYILGHDVKPAIAMSLGVVGATSAVGAIGHFRHAQLDLRAALTFAPVAMLGTFLGARLALSVPETAQLVLFALTMLTAAVFMCFLLAMAFGAIALAIGAATGRRALAVGVTAGIAAVTYLLDVLVPAIESIEFLQLLSPFHYYLGAEPMMRGLDVGNSLVLAGIAAAAFGAAIVLFERRDLAA